MSICCRNSERDLSPGTAAPSGLPSSEETIAKELTGTWQVEQLFVLQQALILFDALRRMRCLATAMPPTFGLRLGRYHQVTHA